MKTVSIEETSLATCVNEAQQGRIVITRNGEPIALVVGIDGMDEEQIQLGGGDQFWKLVVERRQQRLIGRAELERIIGGEG